MRNTWHTRQISTKGGKNPSKIFSLAISLLLQFRENNSERNRNSDRNILYEYFGDLIMKMCHCTEQGNAMLIL